MGLRATPRLQRTDSELRGWYLTKPVRQSLARGELVVFPVPAHVAGLVAQRRWLPPHVPLFKQVGGEAGEQRGKHQVHDSPGAPA